MTDGSPDADSGREHARVREIFHAVFDLSEDERRRRLRELDPEPEVLRAVEELLGSSRRAGAFADGRVGIVGEELVRRVADTRGSPPHPERIGDYRILRRVGEGGMGVVYAARREEEGDDPGEVVALKVIRPGLEVERLTNRFLREVQVLRTLHHPGIAAFRDAGTAEVDSGSGIATLPYLAMELVEGSNLRRYCEDQELSDERRVELIARILDALEAAHSMGVVHRDLKPDNVLVVPRDGDPVGQPKLLDFGVARAVDTDFETLTRTGLGTLVGTLPYMSPEQVGGGRTPIDRRSDVYGVGVLGFELLAGRLPYGVRDVPVVEAARVIQNDSPTRLGSLVARHRGSLEHVFAKALEKEPDARYATAAEFAVDLRRYLRGEAVEARGSSLTRELRSLARQHRTAVSVSIAVIATLALGLVVSAWFAIGESRARRVAEERGYEAEREAHRARLRAASTAIASGNAGLAKIELDRTPPSLRGWEWDALAVRAEDYEHRWELGLGPPLVPQLAFQEAEERLVLRVCDGASDSQLFFFDYRTGEALGELILPRLGGIDRSGHWFAALEPDRARVSLWSVPDANLRGRIDLAPDDALQGELDFIRAWDPSEPGLVKTESADGTRWVMDLPGAHYLVDFETGTWRRLADRVSGNNTTGVDRDWSRIAVDDPSTGFKVIHLQEDRVIGLDDSYRKSGGVRSAMTLAGDRIAWSLPDGVGLWRVTTDDLQLEHTLPSARGRGATLAFSGDGSRLAVASYDPRTRIWDPTSGEELVSLTGRRGPASHMAMNESGDRVASLSEDGAVCVWRVPESDPRVLDIGDWLYAAEVGPTGERVFVGTNDGYLHVLDLKSRAEIMRWPIAPGYIVDSLECHATRPWLVANLWKRYHVLEDFAVFDLSSGKTLREPAHRPGVLPTPRILREASLSPTAERVASVSSDGVLRIYGLPEVEVLASRAFDGSRRTHTSVAIDHRPQGDLLACTVGERVLLLDAANLDTLAAIDPEDDAIESIAFSPDGEHLAIANRATVTIHAIPSMRETARLEGHDETVFDVTWTPDGSRLFTSSRDFTIRIWDTATWTDLTYLAGHEDYVYSVSISPDGDTLVSCGGDGTVRFWEPRRLPEILAARERFDEVSRNHAALIEELREASPAMVRDRLDTESLTAEERKILDRALWPRTARFHER